MRALGLGGPLHTQPVADWLETNPANPYWVNPGCSGIGDRLYLSTAMIRGPKQPAERRWFVNVGAPA